MTTTTRFISMAAAALVAAVMTGCSSSDDGIDTPPQPENTGKVVTLTTTVGFDDKAGTRALDIDFTNKKAVKTFAEGETMAIIYKNTSGETVRAVSAALKAEDITTTDDPLTDKKNATFTVTMTDPDCNAPIRYIYPAAMAKETVATDAAIDDEGTVDFTNLNAQDGTMDALGSALDLCTYDAANWTSGALPSGTLSNQLAVLAVTVKDDKATATTEDDELVTTSVTRLTVSDGTNKYTATGCDADGHIYLAVLPTDKADITVDIYTDDYATTGHHYVKALAEKKSYAASNLYNVGWKVNQYAEPMTMEATTAGTIKVNNPRSGMQYSKNGGAKAAVTSDAISVSAGDKVEFYGNSAAYYSNNGDYTSIAGGTAEVKVYGNIMSLVDEFGFATATELIDSFTFSYLFKYNQKLKDASGLLLPATTLATNCYEYMFSDCTNLTAAPAELPATMLAQRCYSNMFYECYSLTTAPELPAERLAEGCYADMFAYCYSLTAAPALPAEMLCLSCYDNMFLDCTGLTTAPELPATTLAQRCYAGMFQGCTNLSAVTCLATDINAYMCTTNWLANAGTELLMEEKKTFTKAASMKDWTIGPNGIPSGWMVEDYDAPTQ